MPDHDAEDEVIEELTRKFDAAWAAVIGGVSWNPGDHDSIGGVTKDEALEYAAEFLIAYRDCRDE